MHNDTQLIHSSFYSESKTLFNIMLFGYFGDLIEASRTKRFLVPTGKNILLLVRAHCTRRRRRNMHISYIPELHTRSLYCKTHRELRECICTQ